jgi:hypothetical protein
VQRELSLFCTSPQHPQLCLSAAGNAQRVYTVYCMLVPCLFTVHMLGHAAHAHTCVLPEQDSPASSVIVVSRMPPIKMASRLHT